MKDMLMFMVGLAVVIIIVGGVAIPLLYQPTTPTAKSVTNTTTLVGTNGPEINGSRYPYKTFVTPTPDNNQPVVFVITAQGPSGNLTNAAGTALCQFLNDTKTTCAAVTTTLGTTTTFNFTTPAAASNATNITAVELHYYQQSTSTQQGWNAAVLTFWNVLLGIVIVAAVILVVMK